jgi:hypothetical protein
MSKNILESYEAKKLNALIEPAAKRHAFKKLAKYQDGKGWTFSAETNEFNEVSDEEDFEREIYLNLNGKMLAIFASDRKGVVHSVDELLALAENDSDSFNALYELAVEQNPGLKETGEGETNPN